MSESKKFEDLPQELIKDVISLLDQYSVCKLGETSRKFHTICLDKRLSIWKNFLMRTERDFLGWKILRSLVHFPHLKVLDLSKCTSLHSTFFETGFGKLECAINSTIDTLILKDNIRLTELYLRGQFTYNLTALDLSGCSQLGALSVDKKMTKLKQLKIRDTDLRIWSTRALPNDWKIHGLEIVPDKYHPDERNQFHSIETLDISNFIFKPLVESMVTASTSLKSLVITDTMLLETMRTLLLPYHLSDVDFSGTSVTDDIITRILCSSPNVHSLKLVGCLELILPPFHEFKYLTRLNILQCRNITHIRLQPFKNNMLETIALDRISIIHPQDLPVLHKLMSRKNFVLRMQL